MVVRNILLMVVLAIGVSTTARAQKPVTKGEQVTATATIVTIDSTTRSVTLRDEKGEEDTYTLGPSVERFNELKVGDKVKATYYESMAFQVRKPGEAALGTTGTVAATPAKGAMPGGTYGAQLTTTVTVKAVDPAIPSITVVTQDGRTVTRKVDDKKNLEGVKVGDRIDLTYTQALLLSVERAPGK
jgi:Cu/Ag efflux protein CusF